MRYLSLFSGIEAASEAWAPLGWECAGVSEIDPFACNVLAQRHPGVPNLGDITKITESDIARLGHLDLIVFGSPCQDLSVAGKRKGLDGARSGLFFAAMRIIRWARKHCGLRFALWENVPGAFSSNGGDDFGVVVGQMAGLDETDTPPKGWGTEGAILGPQGMVEWAVLDAQWFGVAQRRRRVFAIADFGDWASRPPILLEPESLRGDSAPRREAGQNITHPVAPCLTGSSVLHTGESRGQDPVIATSVALRGREGGATAELGGPVSGTLRASGGGGDKPYVLIGLQRPLLTPASVPPISMCLNAGGMGRLDYETETLLAFNSNAQPDEMKFDPALSAPLTCSQNSAVAIAFSCNDHGADVAIELAPTMRAMGHSDSHANAGHQLAVCITGQVTHTLKADGFDASEDGTGRGTTMTNNRAYGSGGAPGTGIGAAGDPSPTLSTCHAPAIAYSTKLHNTASNQAGKTYEEYTVALDRSSPPPALLTSMQVRRLTPTECERLQAFPDGHTAITVRGKPAADGPRYKALGNSMCVNVMHWIGKQIDHVVTFY